MLTLAQWVSLPENRSAWAAVERVADCVASRSGGINAGSPLILLPSSPDLQPALPARPRRRRQDAPRRRSCRPRRRRRPGLSAVVLTAGDFDRDPAELAPTSPPPARPTSSPSRTCIGLSAGAVEAGRSTAGPWTRRDRSSWSSPRPWGRPCWNGCPPASPAAWRAG